MAGNFKVGMTLTAKDEASQVLEKGQKQVIKATEGVTKATRKAGAEQKRTEQESINSTKKAAKEIQRAARARETLGIRAEREIRREIYLTVASYNRLARAGFESAQEQERAMQATREKARALKRELDGVTQAQMKMAKTPVIPERGRFARAAAFGGNAVTIGGGIAAGAAIMAQPVKRQMSYERQLAMMANTAFSDGGLEGRRAGLEQMKSSIRNAVTYGGGTKEDAAETLDALLKDGISFETASKWLPELMKYATASGASATDLAKVMIKGKKTFGFRDEDISTVLNMAIAAGKEGSFELNDMARWLSQQMGAASAAGMKGKDDFVKILALNEAAAITAGSSDEAGNNVVNLLAKLTSKDIETAAAGINYNGKGIDFSGTLTEARENGLNPIDALSSLIDKIVASDKRYQELQKKLASARDKGEQTAVYDSMTTLLEGFGVGKLVADRQALMALLAYRNNPEYRKKVEDAINQQRTLPEGQRAGDVDFKFISDTNDFKTGQAKNTIEFSQMDGVKKLADASGTVADAITWAGKEFPGLTTSVVTATTAIKAMTAAAVTFAGLKFITGNKTSGEADKPDDIGDTASKVKDISEVASGNQGRLGKIMGAAGKIVTIYAGYEAAEELYGAVVGDTIKNFTDNHGLFFADDGSLFFTREGMLKRDNELKAAADALPSPEQVNKAAGNTTPESASTQPGRITQPEYLTHWGPPASPINFTTQLVLDGQVVAEAVNKYNLQDGNRGTGGTY
ncbi:phage tail tape measure protein [Escherichia coli]|uniref:phage tail tape measure protein n=1 Tax=Enterobacteriaceae TaxID=543 RepID=UPI0006A4D30D|nr:MULTISPECIES: phage tail tape measure protein [Enterobacteriaceae]EGJ9612710.1 tail length tape measure protein [Salmonella enterica subsp. enterica serovar Infantis]HEB1070644.1 phage tail tape measure protein [Escherichia albertii]EFE1555233.1 tail length tape measure protein [Escherichia coli]EFH6088465.1 tail length tape measure protein [Escherichia coli]EFH6600966.1 tail length tape measure protein [Escherichia coli]